MTTLRPYQRAAVKRTIEHFRRSDAPGCLVLPTGAGKSHVIAELAASAKGRVLVLAHVKELCEQNHHKFVRSGNDAGIFSAGLNRRDTDCKVTFASIQSVAPDLGSFSESFSLLIIDECHRVSAVDGAQYTRAIAHLRERNPRLKVLGLTATPYRLDLGWCYQKHQVHAFRTDDERPFDTCIYEVSLEHLIREGYLTPPEVRSPPSWAELVRPQRDAARPPTKEPALPVGEKRATELVVADIVATAEREKRRGVMIFAASAAHARRIVTLLPEGQAALVLGETKTSERDQHIAEFCAQKRKYLVNVAVLTTGFDAPHVDFIALLRKTESVSLFQQIVGRGLRLFSGKRNCLVIDYAQNGFDLFSPEIGERRPPGASEVVCVPCPVCSHENQFWGKKDDEQRVIEHFGRRCHGMTSDGTRCSYRFVFKECPHCHGENDIAARACAHCTRVLVDPDRMLKAALTEKNSLVLRVSGVHYAVDGERLTLTYHDEDGATVRERFDFGHQGQRAVFNRVFARRLAQGRRPLTLLSADQAKQLEGLLPRPDFVIAKRVKGKRRGQSYFRVEERVFDYRGPYRTAAAAASAN